MHYTVLYSDDEERLHLVDDFKGLKNCTLFKASYKDKNIFTHILRKINLSYKINQKISLPLKKIWYSFLELKFDPKKDIVIIYASVFHKYDEKIILGFLQERGIRTYLIFLDSMDAKDAATPKIQHKIIRHFCNKNILSFSKEDCDKYGFIYLNEAYYHNHNLKSVQPKYDIYFVGKIKPGREKIINSLYRLSQKYGIKAKFDLVAIEYDFKKWGKPRLEEGLACRIINDTSEFTPYEKVLKAANEANCIVEIGQDGQNAPSLRYFEAVTLNKKLLTNIKYTKNLNFYNKRYMKVTDFSEENLDFNWMKRNEKVDYNYNGEFSPRNILDLIKKELNDV